MRFLFYRYNSICEPDMIEALESLGHSVEAITLEMAEKNPTGEQIIKAFRDAFDRGAYDAVISVNFFPAVSTVCRAYGLLYISWTVDEPVMELLSDTALNDVNRIFCFDMSQCMRLRERGAPGVFYMPLATNVNRWDRVIAARTKRSYESDISFVGSMYTEKCPYDDLKDPPEYLRGYLEGLMSAQQQVYGAFIMEDALTEDITRAFAQHTKDLYVSPRGPGQDTAYIIASWYLAMKVTSMERLEVMKLLGEHFKVDLYTGSDAASLPVQVRGRAKTLTEMPLIFNESRINLNITCKAIRTGLSQRIWDVMGSGGFLLTNYQGELPEFFVIGEDLDIYSSMEELLEKVSFYLEHEETRQKMAKRGYEKVKSAHTYRSRLQDMLSLVFGDRA